MTIFVENLKYSAQTFKLFDAIITLEGDDAVQFIHSQTTNNVVELEIEKFQFNSLLDSAGKLISSFILMKKSYKEIIILCDKSILQETLARLEKYHISEDFEMNSKDKKSYLHVNTKIDGYKGSYFFENNIINFDAQDNLALKEDENLLSVLTGVLKFSKKRDFGKLINNTYYDELSIDYKKGCFPGQETVSKINTRRGAAYKPVLIMVKNVVDFTENKSIYDGNRKIGTVIKEAKLANSTYILVELLREYRVDKKQINFKYDNNEIDGVVFYLPYIPTHQNERVQELYDYAVELFHDNKEEDAVNYFKKCLQLDSTFEDAYESLGVLYGRQEKYDLAIEMMNKLKTINPKCMMALTNLSLYHMKIGKIEAAEEYKSQATLLNFQILGDEAEIKRKQEEVDALKKNEAKRRESMFTQVLEMDPEDAMANNGMGEIFLEKEQYDEAKIHFYQAIKTDPKYSVAYLGLAKCLFQLQQNEEYKNVLDEGIKIASKNGDLMPANEMQSMLAKSL